MLIDIKPFSEHVLLYFLLKSNSSFQRSSSKSQDKRTQVMQ